MELSAKDLLKLFSKNLRLIAICGAVGLVGAFSTFRFLVQPTYISSAKLYVYAKEDHSNSQDYNNLNDLTYAQKVVNTYIEMLRTDRFYQSVKEKSGLNDSLDDLKKMINFTILNDTEVFQVSVSSHTPEKSKAIADTIMELAPKAISSIKETALLKVVDPAGFPSRSSAPNLVLDSILGFLLGILSAIIYALLKEMLDVRIKQEEDLTSRYNIPILGSIPLFEIHNSNQS